MQRYILPVLVLFTGCNQYQLFRVAGHVQTSFSNDVDILFVVDNSPSMYNEAGALGLNFNTFIEDLVAPESGQSTVTLGDAVDNYSEYVTHLGLFLDYQLAITTTSADPEGLIDPGDAGTLTGAPSIVSPDTTDDVEGAFRSNLLCDTTWWPSPCVSDDQEDCISYDPNYVCGQDPGDEITWEYLDCVCGSNWEQPGSGSGTEEGLEAAFLALCRATPNPPAACYADSQTGTSFWYGDESSNLGLLREGATTVVVIVTDEGDTSRRMAQGEEDPETYLDLLDLFENRVIMVVIGPHYESDTGAFLCAGEATSWGARRYIEATEATGGFYNYIVDQDDSGECVTTDFAQHLEDLGDLINQLTNVFSLQTLPDPATIRVFVDGDEVAEAICTTTDGIETCGDGWSYDVSINAVAFHGSTVPDYNAEVRIYYLPMEELPRDLPF